MPRDRYDVLRMLFGAFFIGTFALVGLSERLHNEHRSRGVERPTVQHLIDAATTFAARWPR